MMSADYTTSTSSNVSVSYVFEEMVTLTVDGVTITLPKRIVLALAAMGEHLALEQLRKVLS